MAADQHHLLQLLTAWYKPDTKMNEPVYSTIITISSKTPLSQTPKFHLINKHLLSELKINPTDPNYEQFLAQDMFNLLEDIRQYEEAIILNKVISILDQGLIRMKASNRPFPLEIRELTNLRVELMKHQLVREDMSSQTRKICEEVTTETTNQSLRLEIQLRRVNNPVT